MLLANENAISSGNYLISNSLRFQSASSQYLSRTFGTPTSATTWTWSSWIKRGSVSAAYPILSNSTGTDAIYYSSSNTIDIWRSSATVASSTAVYRDPASWYHLVLVSNGTTVKGYVNNSEVVSYTGSFTSLGTATSHYIGRTGSAYADGYMAEVNFIDGQALTPSSFGATDAASGQWVAKPYTGTYGTNGFYLPFSNGTSTTTLGADSSGNGNNWTLTNFTRSAGVSDCWMYDVPSGNGSSGTNPNSNYATLNPLLYQNANTSSLTLGGGNLTASRSTTAYGGYGSTMTIPTSGKYAIKFKFSGTIGASVECYFGVAVTSTDGLTLSGSTNGSAANYYTTASIQGGGGQVHYNKAGAGDTTHYNPSVNVANNDEFEFLIDRTNGTIDIKKNGSTYGTQITGMPSTQQWFPFVSMYGTQTIYFISNFTPSDTSYQCLCTANLPVATIKQGNKYMDATTYTGTGSALTITNAGAFKPDLVWVKSRSNAYNNVLNDSVRGSTKLLISNGTDAEQTETQSITSFNSNGFSLGTAGTWNQNTSTFVAWQWQAGQGTTSSNTNGSITSTTSVNATAGFSVVTYTSNSGTVSTVGHGLGVAPAMLIFKNRTTAGTDWVVYHSALGNTKALFLDLTNAATTSSTYFNNTSPTSSVFTIGSSNNLNNSTNAIVCYAFAEIAGFSKFGSYTGNGSTDGPFVYCGFRPKYIMIKRTDTTSDWGIKDSTRSPYNVASTYLSANLSNAESSAVDVDFLSNGFKLRTTSLNNSGGTFIVAAFAENPFAQANAR